jgi:ferredoxin
MCKVKILQGEKELSAPLPAETAKLGPLAGQGYRFACQAKVMGDVTAELPEDPLKAAIRAQLLKSKEEDQLW